MNKPTHFKFRQILHFVLANGRNSSTGHKYLLRSCLKLLKLSKFKKENSSPSPIHMQASTPMSISFLLLFHLCPRKLWGHSSCPGGSWPGSSRESTKQTEVNFSFTGWAIILIQWSMSLLSFYQSWFSSPSEGWGRKCCGAAKHQTKQLTNYPI